MRKIFNSYVLHLTIEKTKKQKLSQLPFHRRLGLIFKKVKNLLSARIHQITEKHPERATYQRGANEGNKTAYSDAEVRSQRKMLVGITKTLCFCMFGSKQDHFHILLLSSEVLPYSLTDQLKWLSPVLILP